MGRLFSSKLLAKYIQAFGFPEDLRSRGQKILNWCDYFQQHPSSAAERAEFIHDLFVDLLGYKSPFTSDQSSESELEFEPEVAIGFFQGTLAEKPEIVAKVIWQDWQISSMLSTKSFSGFSDCKWIICLSDRTISLYSCERDLLSCESFEFDRLKDLVQLKAFYFLFGRRTLLKGNLKSNAPARLELILAESEALEIENCHEFYNQYQKIRLQLVKDFRYRLQSSELISESQTKSQAEVKAQELAIAQAITQAQKLLNRILFISFCESYGILPQGLLRQAYEFHNPYRSQPAWENYRAVFSWLYNGNSDFHPPIIGFNLDLFAFDPLLDQALFVGEELCRQIKELTKFDLAMDFSDRAIAEIFHEILKDLKPLRQDQTAKEKRRRFKFSSKSQTERYQNQLQLKSWLQNSLLSDLAEGSSADTEDTSASLENHPQDQPENWLKIRSKLAQIKILNSKCHTGIYLADSLNLLLSEYQRLDQAIALASKQSGEDQKENLQAESLSSLISQVSSQIYGCDLDPEAIEITKLQLYFRILSILSSAFYVELHLETAEHNQCFNQIHDKLCFRI